MTDIIDIVDPDETVNVMISEDGQRVWVCTLKEGTVLRAKVALVTLDDRRLQK